MANIESTQFSCVSQDGTIYKASLYIRYNVTAETEASITYNIKRGIRLDDVPPSSTARWYGLIGIAQGVTISTHTSIHFRKGDLIGDFYWFDNSDLTFSKQQSAQTINESISIRALEILSPAESQGNYDIPSSARLLTASLNVPALKQYKVIFNPHDHGSAPATQSIYYGQKVIKPTDPKATGYIFLGWYKEPTYQNLWNFDTDVVTESKKLHAKWGERSYTIAYNNNGGTGSATSQKKLYSGSVTLYTQAQSNFSKKEILSSGTTREYIIQKWCTEQNGKGGSSYSPGTTLGSGSITSSLYLYAQWTPKYVYPHISDLKIIRTGTTTSNTEDDEGKYLKISFKWKGYSNDAGSTYSTPTCKITVNGTTTTLTLSGTASSNNLVTYRPSGTYSSDATHTVHIEIYDPNNQTTHREDYDVVIPMAILPIDLYGSGSNVYMGIMHPYVSGQVITVPNLYIDTDGAATIDTAIRTAITNLGWSDVLT